MATAIRCTLPSCTCECFAPGKSQIRTCENCKHGWVAHALDKMTVANLLPSLQVEVVHPNLVYDLASLVLYGTQAVPIRLKIVLDRLFSVLQEEEMVEILSGFGWRKEDYARGYIVQDSKGKVLTKWSCVLESDEGAIFNQFLRFGETRAIAEQMIQDLQNQRNVPISPRKIESDIRKFIECMNKTKCQETFINHVNPSQCTVNTDEESYNQSPLSSPSQSVPSTSTQVPTLNHHRDSSSPKRRKQNCTPSDHVSVPSIHLANLERTVLKAGSETRRNTVTASNDDAPRSASLTNTIQNSVPQIRKRTSVKSSHRSMMSRRRNKTAFMVSANRKRVRCNVCNKWFYDKGTWKIHYSAVHLKVTYKCKVEGCNMVFSSLRSRNRHSVNPNPKIHRIIEQAGTLYCANSLTDENLPSEIKNEWENDQFEMNSSAETIPEELSQTSALLPNDIDPSASILCQSTKEIVSKDPKDDILSVANSLLSSSNLTAPDFLLNTRSQKRKSNTPVRCLAVDDEEVKGNNHIADANIETDENRHENDASPSKSPEKVCLGQNSDIVQDSVVKNVVEDSNFKTQNEFTPLKMEEFPKSSVIKMVAVKSEYNSDFVTKVPISDGDCKAESQPDGICDGEQDLVITDGEKANRLHPSVPPELAGFSPSVDQMGLNADNCSFLLDGFPTCILCQKSFQSRQGVKVHYQNIHLRMMHTCTIEGCNAAFPSRRSRDRHSSNTNLHRKVVLTNCQNDESSRRESDESNSQLSKVDMNSRPGSADTSASQTSDTVKIKLEADSDLLSPNKAPISDVNSNSSIISSPNKGLCGNSPVQDGNSIHMEGNSRQCLPYDSPTLVPPSHVASKLAMVDLWAGPRKSPGGLVCDICMKSYSTKDTLRTHYKNVHIREMHKCTVPGCEMMFSSVRSRNRHSQNPNLHRTFQE